ncbi:carbonic anhydrase [Rickenella mellea]|uniref:Carbonic anhydrase n=1 Tax=Rickenella mellea TaxID=50990 RepID=A0A4Y7QJN8_9AGAM|nr:carbonic anhydrase [Rickenella mellea]
MTNYPVLDALLANNVQWSTGVDNSDPDFFAQSAKGQSPKVLWIGCADSRVPASVITASKPGDIFVHRNIANQFHLDDDSALSVLSYAVEHLGVEHVIVVGHSNCGGAAGAYDAACANPDGSATSPTTPTTPLERWLTPLTSLVRDLGLTTVPRDKALPLLITESVIRQVANICATNVIKNAWAEGKNVSVHGWLYELEDGRLQDLEVSTVPGL